MVMFTAAAGTGITAAIGQYLKAVTIVMWTGIGEVAGEDTCGCLVTGDEPAIRKNAFVAVLVKIFFFKDPAVFAVLFDVALG